MATGKIRVKFEADGHPALINAIKELNKQTKRLGLENTKASTQTKKLNVQQKNQIRNTDRLGKGFLGLGKTLATARSKMLLYAFAVTQATQFVNKLVRTNANIEDMGRAFNNLSTAAGFSSDTFNKLNEAVDGTVHKTNLMQQANNAMLLGIFKSSDQMAEMFDVAQRLGQALGRTANESIESLVTGLGRQSKLMLDNLGIVFSVEKAYEEYARTLNKNVSALTDQEKKQAFTNKAVSIANDLVKQSGEEILGTNAKLAQLSVSFERFQETVGRLVTPVVTLISSGLSTLFNTIGSGIEDFLEFHNMVEQTVTIGKDLNKIVDDTEHRVSSLNLSYAEASQLLKELSEDNNLLGKSIGLGIENFEVTAAFLVALKDHIENFKTTVRDKSIFDLFPPERTDQLSQYMIKLEILAGITTNASNKFKEFNEELELNKVKVSEVSEITPKYTEFQRQLSASIGLLPEEIENLTTNAQQGARAVDSISRAMVAMAGDNKERIISGLKLAKFAAIADSIAGASKSFAQGGIAGFAGGVSMLASMMQRISAIDQQISSAQSEKFEQGGLIGGRRHSQGGTMINAEGGEFVMSRNAVSSIGVENLNRMNQGQGGGGGNISININGGIISPEFVENDLAEAIREAARRGADFTGIS